MDEEGIIFSPKKPLDDDIRQDILEDLNIRIGGEVENLDYIYQLEDEFVHNRDFLRSSLNAANDEVPTKLSTAIQKAELNSKHIENLKERSEKLKKKTEDFLQRNEPVLNELDKRFSAVHKLQEILAYFKSYAQIEEISNQLKQCKDDEQMVILYKQLLEMYDASTKQHHSAYVREYTQYWYNIIRDHLTKNYEDVMKVIKWPFSSGERAPIPSDVLSRFSNLTKYLFMIREPDAVIREINIIEERFQVLEPSLPVKILLRPLKKRFMFHFTGSRQTARIDRPEWFLTQTLTWIRDHQKFVHFYVQLVADKLGMKHVHAVLEFNTNLVMLAAERLHTVLTLYQSHGLKGEIEDVDAAFAHAVDETLGFHRELRPLTQIHTDSVLSVLTKAETFVRWLALEKKYALSKMDEVLENDQWIEPVATGVGAAVGSVLWVPRGSDWFVSMLMTMEDRYFTLTQPGHRLQFLELQLDLIDEWRVRLTQLMSAAIGALRPDTFLAAAPTALVAIINTAHHLRTVLLLCAHSLEYLHLHYYRTQFHDYTQQQHRDESARAPSPPGDKPEDEKDDGDREQAVDDTMCLKDVEVRAKKLAISDVSKHSSAVDKPDAEYRDAQSQPQPAEGGRGEVDVFGDAPALLAALRDAGLDALVDHIVFEFKATTRDYKKQKWHAMPTLEQKALSVSPALCAPLAALCARLAACTQTLAPRLAETLRMHLAKEVDDYLYEEVCLSSWFNTGGALQLTHDVQRCLAPALAPPVRSEIAELCLMPKLIEACRLLNMDYGEARRLRTILGQVMHDTIEDAQRAHASSLPPAHVRRILAHRTDLGDNPPDSLMELF